jgi:hypothetical protein
LLSLSFEVISDTSAVLRGTVSKQVPTATNDNHKAMLNIRDSVYLGSKYLRSTIHDTKEKYEYEYEL